MTTHESYVSLETAKMLKEAGFDWKCINRYIKDTDLLVPWLGEANWNDTEWGINDYNSAPTLAVAQRWLREVKHYVVEVNLSSCYDHFFCDLYYYKPPVDGRWVKCMQEEYDNYEQALEAGIQKCLTILLEERL